MSRQKTIFNFSKYGIKQLKQHANIKATQAKMQEMFKNPELAELIEEEICIAIKIIDDICEGFKITGKPDMEYIKREYEYYKDLNQINPEYENFLE